MYLKYTLFFPSSTRDSRSRSPCSAVDTFCWYAQLRFLSYSKGRDMLQPQARCLSWRHVEVAAKASEPSKQFRSSNLSWFKDLHHHLPTCDHSKTFRLNAQTHLSTAGHQDPSQNPLQNMLHGQRPRWLVAILEGFPSLQEVQYHGFHSNN